jgi:HlyD family secretion protein
MATKGSFRWIKWLVILVVTAAVIGGVIWAFARRAGDAPQYQTATVTRGDLIQAVTATGTLNPVTNVTVGSQISGNIQKLFADFNSHVTAGQVVAQLDAATYKANLSQAEGDFANAKANEELAKVEADRAAELFKNKLISQSDYDKSVATFHQASAQVQIKQASVDNAKVNLSRCTIYAPVDGIVISRSVDVGQTVAASMSAPTLFMIANDLTKMQIDANVSEADIGSIEEDQTVNFTVDAFPDRKFTGKVRQIRNSPTTVQNVVTYDVVIDVNNPDLKLRPGMTANASLVTAERTGVLRIPNAALRFRPPETAVKETKPAATGKPGDTNKLETAALTGNEPPEELMRRVREMRARGEEIPPEIGAKVRELFAAGGFGGGRGGGRRGGGEGGARGGQSSSHTLYTLAAGKNPEEATPQPVRVRTGISDGTYTEVTDGLKEGDVIITGFKLSTTTPPTAPGGASPFGGGGGGFRRGGF